jgi:hypothetical protein
MDLPGRNKSGVTIKGASGKKPGNDGRADIAVETDDVCDIYEVKPASNDYGRPNGPKDLERYIANLQVQLRAKGDPRPAQIPSAELGRPIRYRRPGIAWYLRHAHHELGHAMAGSRSHRSDLHHRPPPRARPGSEVDFSPNSSTISLYRWEID